MSKKKGQGFEISDGYNILMLRAEESNYDEVYNILNSNKQININSLNKKGYTALAMAVKTGSYDIVKLLISKGADVNMKNNSGQSPLFLSCWCNYINIVRLLLESGAEINTSDQRNWSPLTIAAYHGYIDIVTLLLQYNADPNLHDSFGKRAIDRTKDPKIIKLLQNYERNVQPPSILRKSSKSNLKNDLNNVSQSYAPKDRYGFLNQSQNGDNTPQSKRGNYRLSLNTSTSARSPTAEKKVTWQSPSKLKKVNMSLDDLEAHSPRRKLVTQNVNKSFIDRLSSPIGSSNKNNQRNKSKTISKDLEKIKLNINKSEIIRESSFDKEIQMKEIATQVQKLIEQNVSKEVSNQIEEYKKKLKQGVESLVYTKLNNAFKDLQASFNLHLKSLLLKLGYDQSMTSLAQIFTDEESFIPKEMRLSGLQVNLLTEKETIESHRSLKKNTSPAMSSSRNKPIKTWKDIEPKRRKSSPIIGRSSRNDQRKITEQSEKGTREIAASLVEESKQKIDQIIQNEMKKLDGNIFGEISTNINELEEEAKKKFETMLANKFAQLSDIMANSSIYAEDPVKKTVSEDSSFLGQQSSVKTTISKSIGSETQAHLISVSEVLKSQNKNDKNFLVPETLRYSYLKEKTEITRESLESVEEVEESAKDFNTIEDLKSTTPKAQSLTKDITPRNNQVTTQHMETEKFKVTHEVERIEELPLPVEIPNTLGTEYQIDKIRGFYEKRSLSDVEEKPTKQQSTSKNQSNDKRHNNTSPSIVGHFLTIQPNKTGVIQYEFSND